jgi:hypothetical protein
MIVFGDKGHDPTDAGLAIDQSPREAADEEKLETEGLHFCLALQYYSRESNGLNRIGGCLLAFLIR